MKAQLALAPRPNPALKIAVCIPSYGHWHANTAFDMIQMIAATTQSDIPFGTELRAFNASTSILPDCRRQLVEMALEWGATHILWVDSDMRFPADGLVRLLRHDLAVVGANYVQRRYPHLPTAMINGVKTTSHGRTGVERAQFMGFGFLLMKASVFRRIEKPWFIFQYAKQSQQYIGEDVYLFSKAAEIGIHPHVDHDLSQEIAHIGEMEFDFNHFAAIANDGGAA